LLVCLRSQPNDVRKQLILAIKMHVLEVSNDTCCLEPIYLWHIEVHKYKSKLSIDTLARPGNLVSYKLFDSFKPVHCIDYLKLLEVSVDILRRLI
jgi:hypothetical protein